MNTNLQLTIKALLLLGFLGHGGGNFVWGETVNYTISSKNTLTTTGTAPTGSSATIAEIHDSYQMIKDESQTLTLTGYNGYKITQLVLSMHSNKNAGAGSLTYSTDGGSSFSTIIDNKSFNDSSWHGSWSQDFVNVTKSVDIVPTTATCIIKIEATENSLYCQSYTITYESTVQDTRTPVNISSFTATSQVLVKGATTTTTVTNDQTGWTAAYTYASDNESVATVDGDGNITAVAKGTANITVSPRVSSNDEYYKTGTSAELTITVNNPSHTAHFSVNGNINTENNATVEEGESITFPTVADIYGKSFVGWATATIDGTTDTAPEMVASATMGGQDVTYYAVFADKILGNATTTTDVLTATGIDFNTYTSWSGKSFTSSAVYAGNSTIGTGTNSGALQIRASDNSGIVSTTTGGKATEISVVWNSNTLEGRTLDIYGKNTAYTSSSDLYDTSKQGTKIGSIIKGTSTELTISGEYAYIGLRSSSDALYFGSISIDWMNGTPDTYSDYCTTVTTPNAASVTIAASGYGTYCCESALTIPADNNSYKAYIVTAVSGETVTFSQISGDIKARVPFILYGTAGKHQLQYTDATGSEPSGNMLRGTLVATPVTTEMTIDGKDYTLFGLSGGSFVKINAGTIPANKAYLPVLTTAVPNASRSLRIVFNSGDGAGISAIDRETTSDNRYVSLSGQHVAQPRKGLYIVNGRKVIVK